MGENSDFTEAAAKKIEDGVEETPTYADFPSEHWLGIRTNNAIERLNREIRRRTRVVGYLPIPKQTLLVNCDVVTLHGRLNPSEAPIMGKEKLAMMKSTAYLINTVRAALVDMDALGYASISGAIMDASFDAFFEKAPPQRLCVAVMRKRNAHQSQRRGHN